MHSQKHSYSRFAFSLIAVTCMLVNPSFAASDNETAKEILSTSKDQADIAVSIYSSGLGLVKDRRSVTLPKGLSALALQDVSAQMRPETAFIHNLSNPSSFYTLEQNFNYDLLSPQKLLEKSLGKTVELIDRNPATGAEKTESGTLLAYSQGYVLQVGKRIETNYPGRIVFNGLPEDLRRQPTLVALVDNNNAGKQNLELTYLTKGLGWKADYVAELNDKEDRLDLSAWVTLSNTSGTAYRNAKLQLIAGDVNQVQPQFDPRFAPAPFAAAAFEKTSAQDAVSQESFSEYHLYTLPRATSLDDNQTKQVALFNANAVPARKELIFLAREPYYYYTESINNISTKIKASFYLEFDNNEAARLGIPLPKGIIRAYQKDSSGNAQFLGENNIDHTAKNETVSIKLGEAFDVTADKTRTDFKQIAPNKFETEVEFILKNAKKDKVTVKVREPIASSWKMLSETAKHTKLNSDLVEWKIDIPAEGSTTLKYRVRTELPKN